MRGVLADPDVVQHLVAVAEFDRLAGPHQQHRRNKRLLELIHLGRLLLRRYRRAAFRLEDHD
jgi:hypothetical protein